MKPPVVIAHCKHEALEFAPHVVLPQHLGATERNKAAVCDICGVVFMAVRTSDGRYRDYRDVDFGGRRP